MTSQFHGYMTDVKVNHVIVKFKMPKQKSARKRASSAHLVRQAKKRKETKEKIPLRDSKSRKEMQPLEDYFVLKIQKDG